MPRLELFVFKIVINKYPPHGQRTFDYFGSIFYNNFIAGSKCSKLSDINLEKYWNNA